MTINLKKKKLDQLDSCPQFAHTLFRKYQHFARISRLDILWSVNKLARAVTKWTKACDKRLVVWSLTFITHVIQAISHSTTMQTGTVSRLWFCRRPWRLEVKHQGIMCMFGSHTFVPISWMSKKQTSVSHSSTEAEVISLGACLRMDGIPALDLWDLVIEVCHSSSDQTNKTKDVRVPRWNLSANIRPNMRKQIPTNHTDQDLTNIDHLPSNGTHSGSKAMLYVFEDNEAVMKMVMKGRSLTMRHVFLTHRLALDWLFDRINLDSEIQIRYSDTKHQLADVLTKGNFTRDEWNNLLQLFNISHFSSTCCA